MLLTFARNSLIRDMTFRSNFIIEVLSSMAWMVMNLGFYLLIFQYAGNIGGWEKHQFFAFIATTMLINSMVQAMFMPNMQELSELVRTGGLDFALLKPIDTQFLISLRKISWSSLGNFTVAILLLVYAAPRIEGPGASPLGMALYPLYIAAGVLILYSVMISLAATSIWMGRNQTLYDFWFYITNFSRYPMEIYNGTPGNPGTALGRTLGFTFTYIIPILVVINVPARIMAKPLTAEGAGLILFAALATAGTLWGSRWVFKRALESYRSASS
ncbi:MAG: ABC-2 family transporter protein [Planctomycetota bacterium]